MVELQKDTQQSVKKHYIDSSMFTVVLVIVFLGVLAGIITGLIPGIHVNLVATVVLSLGIGPHGAVFLVSLAVTHSFLDAIPSVLLGAPESAMALGVLPGHRYVLKGWGYMAIKLTLIGSFFGLLLAMVLIPVWWLSIRLYPVIQPVLAYLLIAVSAYLILRDSKQFWALFIYVLAGIFGFLLLNTHAVKEPLFPLFSGLFGVSTLLYSLTQSSHIPTQEITSNIRLRKRDVYKALLAGNLSGFLTSMLPGLGSAQGAVLGMTLARDVGDHGFLVLLGSINTVNFTLSLLTWLSLNKARNGAVVAIQQLTHPSVQLVFLLFIAALLAGCVAVPLCLVLSRIAIRCISRISYRKLCIVVILCIGALVLIISGWRGFLTLLFATCIGLIPAIIRCSRAHAMGCLLLPTIWYFIN